MPPTPRGSHETMSKRRLTSSLKGPSLPRNSTPDPPGPPGLVISVPIRGVRVRRREPSQRQRDRGAGRVGGVEGDVEGAALQSVAAVLPPQRRRRRHGGRRGREEPFDLGDGDIGAVELDVVAGVVDGDEARGRRQRHPVLLPPVPHVVESRCLDRVETRERVLGCGHDAERQRSEGVDGGDLGEAGDLVEVLGVVGRVGRVGAAGDEVGGRLGAVIGHGAAGRGPCRGRGVEQDQPIDLVRVARREGHGLGAAVGVADDHVRPGLADVAQEGVEVASRGGERLRCCRRVARAGAEAGVGAHSGSSGEGGLDATPVVAAVVEPGDEDDGGVAGADATDVQTSTVDSTSSSTVAVGRSTSSWSGHPLRSEHVARRLGRLARWATDVGACAPVWRPVRGVECCRPCRRARRRRGRWRRRRAGGGGGHDGSLASVVDRLVAASVIQATSTPPGCSETWSLASTRTRSASPAT